MGKTQAAVGVHHSPDGSSELLKIREDKSS